ncbi:hypothetical protein I7I48_03074 [Histoplasma ohiense]|nr:hypothetical protein I7I48_03074 [Histoplasma ohiense (nom. inval.)]
MLYIHRQVYETSFAVLECILLLPWGGCECDLSKPGLKADIVWVLTEVLDFGILSINSPVRCAAFANWVNEIRSLLRRDRRAIYMYVQHKLMDMKINHSGKGEEKSI